MIHILNSIAKRNGLVVFNALILTGGGAGGFIQNC